MIDLLPNELLDRVGQWLDDDDLKVATMVCELFRDIFFPQYLRRNNLSPRQVFISLKGLSNFRAFRSYHRFPHRPRRAHLSTFFSRDADADTEISCLAYALAQLPARTFRSISLCFSRYNPIHAEPLTDVGLGWRNRIAMTHMGMGQSVSGVSGRILWIPAPQQLQCKWMVNYWDRSSAARQGCL